MNIGGFFKRVGKGAAWPFKKIDEKIGEELAEKASLAMAAVLNEAPVLDDLLDGKPVDIVVTVQMKRRG